MKARTTILLAAMLMASVSFGQTTTGEKYASLASARAKITQVIDNPKEMTAVMQTLSPANQKVFLAEVMAAISSMPADESDRTAKFVDVVNAALAGTQKGNALTLVAEVFATVPPISLTAVNESLAAGLMNRAADGNATYTDEQYIKIMQLVMEKVNERVANEDNAGVRSGFAALMLIRGSNSESPEIFSAAVAAMPEAFQNDAKTEWFPAALGLGGQEKTYEPMLAVVDNEAGKPVSSVTVAEDDSSEPMIGLRVSGIQNLDCLLADISRTNTDPKETAEGFNPVVDAIQNRLNYELPNLGVGDGFGNPGSAITRAQRGITEARGYKYQTTK